MNSHEIRSSSGGLLPRFDPWAEAARVWDRHPDQRRPSLCRAAGALVARFYKDEAESGVKEDRKALLRLLRDCRAGRAGSVVLPSLDRLSRDVRIAENLFHEFEQLGIDVLIADMPTYNGRDRKDVLVRQIREAIAEENRKEIIERLWKGRRERVRKGLPPGGNVPYGYRRNGQGLTVDDSARPRR